jgi:hypothetical protein
MMRRWAILNGVLAIIVLGLGVQIVRTWARALPPVEARAPGKASEASTRSGESSKRKRGQTDKTTQTPASLVAAIVSKDLFDPSRSKPSEEAKAPVVAVEVTPPPGISLVGIRLFGRDREGFILDATQGNAQRRIRLGDMVGNFTVKTIRTSSVVLASGTGEYVTLTLAVDKTKGGATPVPARPGRAQASGTATGAASPAGGASPAAGVTAAGSPAAGVGGAAKTPKVAAGSPPATTPAPTHPGATLPPTPPQPKGPPISPNLPEGVRQKLEQMRDRRR